MRDDDFEDALARALHGEVMTDLRPSPAMLDALLAIASAQDPSARRIAIRTARRLQQEDPDHEEQDDEPFDGPDED